MAETKAPAAVVPRKLTREERMSMRQAWEERTYKREIAVLGLGVWFLMTLVALVRFLIVPPSDVAMLNAMGTAFAPVYTIATTMIFVFTGAAFGIDAYAKQIK